MIKAYLYWLKHPIHHPASSRICLQDGRTIYEAMADLVSQWGNTTTGKCDIPQ